MTWCNRCGCGNDEMGYAHLRTCKLAIELLTEAAEHPECDELFARVEQLSPLERYAMIERDRAARAAWGTAIEVDDEANS